MSNPNMLFKDLLNYLSAAEGKVFGHVFDLKGKYLDIILLER